MSLCRRQKRADLLVLVSFFFFDPNPTTREVRGFDAIGKKPKRREDELRVEHAALVQPRGVLQAEAEQKRGHLSRKIAEA